MSYESFIGKTINERYQVLRKIGEGQRTIVHLAYDEQAKEHVGVKIFNEGKNNIITANNEAIIHGFFNHPHVIPLVEQTVWSSKNKLKTNKHAVIVMPYANKGSLRQHLMTYPLPSPEQTIHYVTQSTEGIQHIHEQGIVHRDIKPENLLLTTKRDTGLYQHLYISDFGISLPEGTPLSSIDTLGTPDYSAPEQTDRQVIKAADQYSLGIIAYELFTGERPFVGSARKLEYAHKAILPLPFERTNANMTPIIEAVEVVVQKALAKNPQERYGSVADFGQELRDRYEDGLLKEKKRATIIDLSKRLD